MNNNFLYLSHRDLIAMKPLKKKLKKVKIGNQSQKMLNSLMKMKSSPNIDTIARTMPINSDSDKNINIINNGTNETFLPKIETRNIYKTTLMPRDKFKEALELSI